MLVLAEFWYSQSVIGTILAASSRHSHSERERSSGGMRKPGYNQYLWVFCRIASRRKESEWLAALFILPRSYQTQVSTDYLTLPRYASLCSCEPAILTYIGAKGFLCVDFQQTSDGKHKVALTLGFLRRIELASSNDALRYMWRIPYSPMLGNDAYKFVLLRVTWKLNLNVGPE